jgi:transcriptional regulator with GAF, ATPase, and Fis domain/tetratricopeptide (TPR) repeat protein
MLTARVAAESDPLRKARLLVELAQLKMPHETEASRAAAEQAAQLVRALGGNEPALLAQALALVAEANWTLRNLNAVAAPAEEALKLAMASRDTAAEYRAANYLGNAMWQAGNCERAVALLQQALAAAERLEDRAAVARVSNNLGTALSERGELDNALASHFRALAIFEELRDSRNLGITHLNLGATYGDLGDWEKAVEYFYRALIENEKLQDRQGMAGCYINVAQIYLKRSKHERALQCAEQAVKYAEEANSPFFRLAALGVMGEAYALAGDFVRARSVFEHNVRAAQDFNLPDEQAVNLRRKADLLLSIHDSEAVAAEAVELLDQALAAVGASGPQLTRAAIQQSLGRAYALRNDTDRARPNFESAVAILRTTGKSYDLARVYFDYGRFLVDHDATPQGLALVQEAAKIFKRLEVITESDAVERYLLQKQAEPDRRLALLRSLSSLTSHSLPLTEFAPRCLELLRDALGFSEASFYVEDERRPAGDPRRTFLAGKSCTAEELALCRRGEVVITGDKLCLPVRLSGRNVGGIYLRWLGDQRLGADDVRRTTSDVSFLEIVSNLLSVAIERNWAQQAVGHVEPRAAAVPHYPGFIGNSRPILEIYKTIEQVAPTNACVLIQGESGTGKEMIARIVHQRSPRTHEAFVALNCAALPEGLLESELFGIEKGVATGVVERKGRFEQAHRGTLFLDEIGDMTMVLQAKLLRVLQDHQFERVGGRKTIEVDTRIIAATNKNLEQAIAEGRFRNDLYYRLNVITLHLPPLRERQEDIPLMVAEFIAKYNEEFQRRVQGVSSDVLECMLAYRWPGNVRELKNVIERAVIICRTETVQMEDLPPALQQQRREAPPTTLSDVKAARRRDQGDAAAALEKNMLIAALTDNKWNAAASARQLGISRSHLYRLLDKYDLQRAPDPD